MRIITWNINSVRLRLDLAEKLIAERRPDVLCLQETKVVDDAFPGKAFAKLGYAHQHFHGMKSYNGVAILSRLPLEKTGVMNWQGREDRRHIFATLSNGIELHCCYVPAGGDVPDPALNPKFAHKLGFLDESAAWWRARKDKDAPKIMVGDFNIAPLECDVWSHKQMIDVVSHTPIEIEKLSALQKAHDWVDAVRLTNPAPEKLYSWWSYRARDWQTSNRGRRLDHIWVTPSLAPSVKKTEILRTARGWKPKPSDHVPVLIDLD